MEIKYHTVYLGDLAHNAGYTALRWLAETIPYSERRWHLRDLCYVEFVNETDATFFRLRWS